MRTFIMLLILLSGCLPLPQHGEQAVSKPVVPQATGVMALPQPNPPVLESEPKAPRDPPKVNVTIVSPPKPVDCKERCAEDCERSAQAACSEKERSQCKANCGGIADPSACSQACAFIHQPSSCRSILQKACTNQCVGVCH